jgi:primosomal protein N' (replication factor Y)
MLPLPFEEAFDYRVPVGLAAGSGSFVSVPLGSTQRVGVVWPGEETQAAPVASDKLKDILEVLDLPPVPEVTRKFVSWAARYTMAPLGSVLRMVMGSPNNLKPARPINGYELAGPPPDRMTSARARVIDLLSQGPVRTMADLMETAGISRAVVSGLVDKGTLQVVQLPEPDGASDDIDMDFVARNAPALSTSQAAAARALCEQVEAGAYHCTLLEGVTGSGKTEVYFEAIAQALNQDPTAQVLVLVPEIALTNQLLSRFEVRFGIAPRAWHSDLSAKQRRAHWRAVISGRARVVVGARSALMLPYQNLKLIVIDEEHDPSYKQEEQVIYHARDMAVVRANLGGCPLFLVSATPSLETVVNCQQGRYNHVVLPERHGGAQLPTMTAIDMRTQDLPPNHWISPELSDAMTRTLAAGEQSLLFLNRRGYAPAAICRGCGHRLQRDNCSAPLVVHRYGNRLQCHHCDYSIPMPTACPNCEKEGDIVVCGPGVERLAEEVISLFPDARVGIMASDNMRSAREAQDFVAQIERHEIDIVVFDIRIAGAIVAVARLAD